MLSYRSDTDVAGSEAVILFNRRDGCIALCTADDVDERLLGSPSDVLLFLLLVSASSF